METALGIILRWVHITGVVILVGGFFYARFCAGGVSPRFRGWIWAALGAVVGSGLYNLLTKTGFPPGYHMAFGIKMLLVLHIVVAGFLVTLPGASDAKRNRMAAGIVFSALAVFLISAWLRWISVS